MAKATPTPTPTPPPTIDIFVSPRGSDKAAGTRQQPVATPNRAVRMLRAKRRTLGTDAIGRIELAGGLYFLKKPLILDDRDNGVMTIDNKLRFTKKPAPTIIESAPGQSTPATLSGGRAITNWKPATVNGHDVWVADLPAVRNGTWQFNELWVDGRRVPRPQFPRQGDPLLQIAKRFPSKMQKPSPGSHSIFHHEKQFGYAPGEIGKLTRVADIDMVALHFWIESRIPVQRIDESRRVIHLARRSRMKLTEEFGPTPAKYYLDNVYEMFDTPGQWYLDRAAGKLYYMPKPGQTIDGTQVIAPVLDHVIAIEGRDSRTKHARHIELRNLVVSHCEYQYQPNDDSATTQAACQVPGAVRLHHAHGCAVRGCTIEHVGTYGVHVTGDSRLCEVTHCHIHDTAAGGVKVFHTCKSQPPNDGRAPQTRHAPWHHPEQITIADCHLHDGGHYWRQAVGVLIGKCVGATVVHNHIHDYDYSGVSVGWTWGYAPSHTAGNIIEWNHIHDIGRGVLSDMGAIYTLGIQPGTRIRYNHIHHVDSRNYGGWGIYPDEGSSEMLIEFNIVHDTKCDSFSQHYGQNNIVRNNIFALPRQEALIGLGRAEPYNSFTVERNIIITDGTPIVRKPYNMPDPAEHVRLDRNLYFDVNGKRLDFNGRTLTAWRKLGHDKHSIVADPKCADIDGRDFALAEDSPAYKLGFLPFDLSTIGPREMGDDSSRPCVRLSP